MESKDCNAGCDGQNDEVFVQWVSFLEQSYVQEHNWEKLAGLGENECNVVDMG